MNKTRRVLSWAFAASLSCGLVSEASADVYGLSFVDIRNLTISFNAVGGSVGLFTFSTNQDATLNGDSDLSSGQSSCAGSFPSAGTCVGVNPRLSGTVQNAPGSAETRAENDYQQFALGTEYSNGEAAIVTAALLGDPATRASSISESNVRTGTSAQASTTVSSNTNLNLTFPIGGAGGSFTINFDADVNVIAQVTGGDTGLAQANSSTSVLLQQGGLTVASWSPQGTNAVTACGAGFTCTATESALSLNNSSSSGGAPNQENGSGSYQLNVTGLTTGVYTLALAATTSTNLLRIDTPPPPPPPELVPALAPVMLGLLACGLLLVGIVGVRRTIAR